MCLHLPDMISDIGPPNSFWCFSYERLNGTLAGIPNSHRSIESEFSTKFIQDILSSHYDLRSIEKSIVPHNLREFISTSDDDDDVLVSQCPLSCRVLYIRTYSYADKFECQMILDRGEIQDWPIKFFNSCKDKICISQ